MSQSKPPPLPPQKRTYSATSPANESTRTDRLLIVTLSVTGLVLLFFAMLSVAILSGSNSSGTGTFPESAKAETEVPIADNLTSEFHPPPTQLAAPELSVSENANTSQDESAAIVPPITPVPELPTATSSEEIQYAQGEQSPPEPDLEMAVDSTESVATPSLPSKTFALNSPSDGENAMRLASNPFLDAAKAASVVFVIDKSGSMGTNQTRVIGSLKEALKSLSPEQKFQVIFFDDVPLASPMDKGLIDASKENIKAITEWMEVSIQPSGGTEPLQAMRMAIDLAPSRIVLLSDGEFDPSYIEEISDYNSKDVKKRIRIDCVGLNEVVLALQEVAKRNGPGIYYQAR